VAAKVKRKLMSFLFQFLEVYPACENHLQQSPKFPIETVPLGTVNPDELGRWLVKWLCVDYVLAHVICRVWSILKDVELSTVI